MSGLEDTITGIHIIETRGGGPGERIEKRVLVVEERGHQGLVGNVSVIGW
jgi:hypothetical protein